MVDDSDARSSSNSRGRLDAADEKVASGARLTLRDQQKMLTRAKLLESALVAFDDKGYGRATVSDIVTGAGASHGTFYLYFPTKASVIVELMEAGWGAELTEHLAALPTLEEPSEELIGEWLQGFLSMYQRHAGTLRAWAQASVEEHQLVGQTDDYVRMMVDGVVAATKAFGSSGGGKKRPGLAPELLAMTLIFELERVCFYKFVRRWDLPDSIVDVLAEQWSHALSPA